MGLVYKQSCDSATKDNPFFVEGSGGCAVPTCPFCLYFRVHAAKVKRQKSLSHNCSYLRKCAQRIEMTK